MRESGRFGGVNWTGVKQVPLTTLDRLIAAHGVPAFMKIDVEGYEYEVLSGLTRPVKVFSIEFTPEWFEKSIQCVQRAAQLGNTVWNFSSGESMTLEFTEWVSADRMIQALEERRNDRTLFGDIYCRFAGT